MIEGNFNSIYSVEITVDEVIDLLMKTTRNFNPASRLILIPVASFLASFLVCEVAFSILLAGRTPWSPASVTYYFSSSLPLPNNNFKSRVREGTQAWNRVASSDFTFTEVTRSDPTAINQGVVTYEFLQSGLTGFPLGKTTFIVFATPPNPNPSRFKVAFSTVFDSSWYVLNGQPSNQQYDFKSTATHEFEHALLLAHSPDPDGDPSVPIEGGAVRNCPNTKVTQDTLFFPTMCFRQKKGETFGRTLGSYDINGLARLYPIFS